MEEPNFDRHIPGQSLTTELGTYPWQKPPQYNTVDDAMQFYAERIMNPMFRDQIAETMELGLPLTSIANALQSNGVMLGKHTIDVGVLILPEETEPMMEEEIAEASELPATGLMARRA